MPKPQWDNIHDVRSPEDLAKSGDSTIQPVEDLAYAVPEMVRTEYGDLPYEYLRRLDQRDPEKETAPVLNRNAFLADQTPNSNYDADSLEDRDLDVSNPSAHVEIPEIPDPFIERVSRRVVAGYMLENYPQEINFAEDRLKVSVTLLELVKNTSSLSTKNEPRCSANLSRANPENNRWDFSVVCGESYSDPSGHEVKFKFLKRKNAKKLWKSRVLVSCSCPFWRYYGCDWNSKRKEYQERQMSDGSAPTVRGKNHLICKHIAACVPRVRLFVMRQK